jgi:parallel beta-helix repeat protein
MENYKYITGAQLNYLYPQRTLYVSVDGYNGAKLLEGSNTFGSIQKAVDEALLNQRNGISTKIVIKAGIYYLENMIHIKGDLSKDAFIHICGEGNVTITGARVWNDWMKEETLNIYSKVWDYSWGQVEYTYEGRVPEIMQYREIVFIDDSPLLPVRSYQELQPGHFFVSENDKKIYISLPEEVADILDSTITVSESGGFIDQSGMKMGNLIDIRNISNFIMENIIFEKAAAGIADGVSIRAANQIIIKNCEFNYNAYSGLRFDGVKNGLIENCKANDNGGKGIAVSDGKNIIIRNTQTMRNNWLGYPNGWIEWDPAGIKFFRGHEIFLENHTSCYNNCTGIWADTDIINMYIECPMVLLNKHFGVWLEANIGPIYIKGGLIEQNGAVGLYNSSTQNLYLESVTFHENEGEIAIGDFNQRGRGPLVSDSDWAADYTNTFGNFETGEGYISHAIDTTIHNCGFHGKAMCEKPIYNYARTEEGDDLASYKPWMMSIHASNNNYSHSKPEKAFYIAGNEEVGYLCDFQTWQNVTKQDSTSKFLNVI